METNRSDINYTAAAEYFVSRTPEHVVAHAPNNFGENEKKSSVVDELASSYFTKLVGKYREKHPEANIETAANAVADSIISEIHKISGWDSGESFLKRQAATEFVNYIKREVMEEKHQEVNFGKEVENFAKALNRGELKADEAKSLFARLVKIYIDERNGTEIPITSAAEAVGQEIITKIGEQKVRGGEKSAHGVSPKNQLLSSVKEMVRDFVKSEIASKPHERVTETVQASGMFL